MFSSDCERKDEKQTLELTSRPPAVYSSVLLPPQNFLPPSSSPPPSRIVPLPPPCPPPKPCNIRGELHHNQVFVPSLG